MTPVRRLCLVGSLVLAALLCGCDSDSPAAGGDELRVVATTSIVGDITAAVGGEDIALTTLIGPDQDSHTYEPRPSDSRALAEADLIVENGRDLEPFLDDLVAASGSDAARVALSAGITLAQVPRVLDGNTAAAERGVGDDPHVWQSPWSGRRMARAAQLALAEADPARTGQYAARARAYDRALEDLEADIAELLSEIPPGRRLLVTSHDTFAYFARAFGFEIVGVVIPATTTEADGGSAGEIADLVRRIRRSGARAVFAENVASDDLVQNVADEAGVAVGGELYSDALGGPDSPAATYLQMQRHNAETIHAALTGG